MKARHLILALGTALALSLAVPALGQQLHLRSGGIASLRLIVGKALRQANAAKKVAVAARGSASAAKRTADGAQATVAAARTGAGDARSAAESAQRAGDGAQSAAGFALNDAANTETQLLPLEGLANAAAIVASGKLGHAFREVATGHLLNGQMRGQADCPTGSFVSGGGYFSTGAVRISDSTANGWVVESSALPSPPELTVWAICLTPN